MKGYMRGGSGNSSVDSNSISRFQYSASDSGISRPDDSPPPSPTNSQQLNNLIEYVVDTLCFSDTNYSFDVSFKAFSSSQLSAKHIHDKEQVDRIDKAFGSKWKQAVAKTAAGVGAGQPIRQESRSRMEQQQQVVPAAGAQAGGYSFEQNTLQDAIAKLNERKGSVERTPEAIRGLTDNQLLEEKRNLKQGLRSFDFLFEKVTGRPPEKADKEPLRSVYAYYKELKKEIGFRGANQPALLALDENDDLPLLPQQQQQQRPAAQQQQPGITRTAPPGGYPLASNPAAAATRPGLGYPQQQQQQPPDNGPPGFAHADQPFSQQHPPPGTTAQQPSASSTHTPAELEQLRNEKKCAPTPSFQ
ncbi:hypothetical protein DIPPA_04063 [Diplonema papillatum]|nr:hypothetical protein DIPPA_04063 [Diplonema papillatum]